MKNDKNILRDLRALQDFIAEEEDRRSASGLPASHPYRREAAKALRSVARLYRLWDAEAARTAYRPLNERDWREVYNTFEVVRADNAEWERANRKLNNLLSINGSNVKLGKLTSKVLREWANGVSNKAEDLRAGKYDDYEGEIDMPHSPTRVWAKQMERIATTLRLMADERIAAKK